MKTKTKQSTAEICITIQNHILKIKEKLNNNTISLKHASNLVIATKVLVKSLDNVSHQWKTAVMSSLKELTKDICLLKQSASTTENSK